MFNRCRHHDHQSSVRTEVRSHIGDHPCHAPLAAAELHVDAEVLGDALKTGRVARSERLELPGAVVPVELAEQHGGLRGGVLGQVVARELHFAGGRVGDVDDADEGVAHLAEALTAVLGVEDRHREDDALHDRRQTLQVDDQPLVVTFALAGEVVAEVLDAAAGRLGVVEEDEVGIGRNLAVGVQQQCRGVEVEVRAGRGANVPAEADANALGTALGEHVSELVELLRGLGVGGVRGLLADSLLVETDIAALDERNSHNRLCPFRDSEVLLVSSSMGLNIPLQIAAVQKMILLACCQTVK